MGLEIQPMNLGEGEADTSFMVWSMTPGEKRWIPCSTYLILGGETPIMVDAGFRDVDELFESSGFPFRQSPEQTLEANLARHGLEPGDIGILLFTHLHLDHTGVADKLPKARLVMQRSELGYAAAPHFPDVFYDRVDIAKIVDPLWKQVELLDGDSEIAPGVRTVVTGGHSPGHQMVYVDVDSGQAVIVGDVAYLIDPGLTQEVPPGYSVNTRDTVEALKKANREGDYLLPMHDHAVYELYPDGIR
ncbi:MAG: N-acyl homoserine lactonase family protein [Actinobacteria bacterium]|nr:N-acyl homoserine lactonase family protein [Actinomycetota bacterium]